MTQRRHHGLWGRTGSPGHVRGERLVGALTVRPEPGAAHDSLRALAPRGVVKRNTLLLAATQALVGVGNQMVPTLGAIIVSRLLGAAHLAGIATSTLGVSRFLVSYPIGRVADLHGRRVAVVIGLLLGLAGAVSTGLSVL